VVEANGEPMTTKMKSRWGVGPHPLTRSSPGRVGDRATSNPRPATSYHVPVPKIRVLSDQIVNRIAAGEVVERPASVVKELVENSLDAGAERIEVELVQGGRSAVRVVDDGCGMDPDDALLALERHATSKITTAGDLDHIATLGFRGEALPSMAAVSRFALLTSADPERGGVRITVDGGRILGVEGASRARGTTVEVRDLFFNTPARRKFLRAPATELRHVQDAVFASALARPDVTFILRHGPRTLIDVPAVADPAQRLRELWPRADGPVHRFEAYAGGVEVWGLLAASRGAGQPQLTVIVNGRPVRDRLLVGAVRRALREAGPGFGGARVALFVDLPPESVDVNVHPAKAEVRFERAGTIFSVVDRALRGGVAASQGRVAVARVDVAGGVAESPDSEYAEAAASSLPRTHAEGLFSHPVYGLDQTGEGDDTRSERFTQRGHPVRSSGARAGPPDTPFGRLIGQYRGSFLLLEDDWGLVIVDQHVAHERVLYDRIRRRLRGENAPCQRLLEPILLEVGDAAAGALPRVRELLEQVGIEAEGFGSSTVRITALPPETDEHSAGEILEDLLNRATSLDGVPEQVAEELSHELAASLACQSAIKVNHPLTTDEQAVLLKDLIDTENPYRCPHGRPIVLRLSQDEMERRLGRR
jgi:DNA mismatch repair protein MutL